MSSDEEKKVFFLTFTPDVVIQSFTRCLETSLRWTG